jgi:hypothetical protein
MSGDRSTRVRSNHAEHPYVPHDGREDPHAPDAVKRVVRGGAFYDGWPVVHGSMRNLYAASHGNWQIGLRIAANVA